jgi:hypothetical protein
VALSGAIAGDAVADLVEAPELFDVDVIAGVIAFTAGAGAEAYSWRTRPAVGWPASPWGTS